MARATGSINYLEHRTPLKDESGKYQIHPMFVKQDVVDREKMEKRVRDHCAMNVSSFISALETPPYFSATATKSWRCHFFSKHSKTARKHRLWDSSLYLCFIKILTDVQGLSVAVALRAGSRCSTTCPAMRPQRIAPPETGRGVGLT